MSAAEPAPGPWPAAVAALFARRVRAAAWSASRPGCRTSTTPTRTATSSRGRSGCSGTPEPGLLHQPAGVHVRRPRALRAALGRRSGERRRRLRGRPDDGVRARPRAPRRVLGALAVVADRRSPARGCSTTAASALLAGALLAVAFLPVHYSHFALNDAPTLAPLAAALVGVAGHLPHRPHARVRARRARRSASRSRPSTRPGSSLVTVIAAAFASPVAHARVRNLALAIGADVRGLRRRQPVRAARPPGVPRRAAEADRDRGRGRRQARPGEHRRAGATTCARSTWGLGWLPSLFALGGARRAARAPPPARRCCSRPRRSCCSSISATSRASSPAGCCRSTRSSACWPRGA